MCPQCLTHSTRTYPYVLFNYFLGHHMPVESNVHECLCYSVTDWSTNPNISCGVPYRFAHILLADSSYGPIRAAEWETLTY